MFILVWWLKFSSMNLETATTFQEIEKKILWRWMWHAIIPIWLSIDTEHWNGWHAAWLYVQCVYAVANDVWCTMHETRLTYHFDFETTKWILLYCCTVIGSKTKPESNIFQLIHKNPWEILWCFVSWVLS